MTSLARAREVLAEAGFAVSEERPIQNGTQLRTASGPILCVWNNGNYSAQGTEAEELEEVLKTLKGGPTRVTGGRPKIFVVYGHDAAAKETTERLLRKWDLEPILLDQQTSAGATLIEKLERYRRDVEYAVVLATPDDEGHRRGFEEEKKKRARQNVVLELGMMLGYLPRERICVIQKDLPAEEWEPPSDIRGIVYLDYSDTVEDVKVELFQEMLDVGIHIDPRKL